jgi:hypothetical protein
MATAFYEPLGGDTYRSTEHTSGPWGPESQHAGPPSALLTRVLERTASSWPGHLTRISLDILGAVPVADLTVSTRVLRPGRSVELVEGELSAGGRPVLRAQAWRMSLAELDLPAAPRDPDPVPEFADTDSEFFDWSGGYLKAMQWRFVPGSPQGEGRGAVWARMRIPLVPDEEPTAMQRLLALADTGNGVSYQLDASTWWFINTELTVHLIAPPAGEWFCLDAISRLDPAGFGLASSHLYDRDKLVALGAQSLFVRPRT